MRTKFRGFNLYPRNFHYIKSRMDKYMDLALHGSRIYDQLLTRFLTHCQMGD